MALKITGKKQDTTFKPVVINLTIEITTKEDLIALTKEFRRADFENYNVKDGNDEEDLDLLTNILEAVEKELY